MYSVIDLYVCVIVINQIMYGFDTKAVSMVYTRQAKQLAESLHQNLPCKTVLFPDGRGLLCYCRKSTLSKLQRIAQAVDEEAACAAVDMNYSFGDILRKP